VRQAPPPHQAVRSIGNTIAAERDPQSPAPVALPRQQALSSTGSLALQAAPAAHHLLPGGMHRDCSAAIGQVGYYLPAPAMASLCLPAHASRSQQRSKGSCTRGSHCHPFLSPFAMPSLGAMEATVGPAYRTARQRACAHTRPDCAHTWTSTREQRHRAGKSRYLGDSTQPSSIHPAALLAKAPACLTILCSAAGTRLPLQCACHPAKTCVCCQLHASTYQPQHGN
jgi:hypothetical protein